MFQRILPVILAAGLFLPSCPGARADVIAPTPHAVELPITPASRPFAAAAGVSQPVELAARGYEEHEYLVSGVAQRYDWAAPGATPAVRAQGGAQPYATRLLVRRPQDRRRASGRVIVELLDPESAQEAAPLWSLSAARLLRRGDVWVGITVTAPAVASLQAFDATRYADLVLAVKQPGCEAASAAAGNGLAWDIIAQAGALLRSSSKENPLRDFNLKWLALAGYGAAGGYLPTYGSVVRDGPQLGTGRPVYDAYVDAAGTVAAVPLGGCAAPLPTTDPRLRAAGDDPPFVAVMLPDTAAACSEPQDGFPAGAVLDAVWVQLDELLLRGTPLAPAQAQSRLSPGAGTAELPRGQQFCGPGATLRFDVAQIKAAYGTRAAYLKRFNAAVDTAMAARTLGPADAAALKAQAAKGLPAF